MTEEEMRSLAKIKVLEEKRHFLCQYLNPQNHFAFLRSVYILSNDDEELIMSKVTRKEKVECFLNILSTRGPNAFDKLCDSIMEERTQMFILEELNKDYENRINQLYRKQQPNHFLLDFNDSKNLPYPSQSSQKNKNQSEI